MISLWIAAGSLLALFTLPGTLDLLFLTVAGMLAPKSRPRQKNPRQEKKYRLAIVVPAHNEQLHIARCVTSLLGADCEDIEREVIVVADNCQDQTAKEASQAGARVLVRQDEHHRGKGFALDFAFVSLAGEGWESFAVVDADSEVASNFLTELTGFLQDGADAVQCRYLVRNAAESIRTRLMRVAGAAFNVLRPRGRDRCGLSAGLYGNGFALSAATLHAVPYHAASVVEDLEYHLSLLRAGRKVRFADNTIVYGDMPASGAGVSTQRARWEGGRLRMIMLHAPAAAREVLRGRMRFLEPCLDLLLLPLAFHVTLLLVVAATPFRPAREIALFGLALVAVHLVAGIRLIGGGWPDVIALLGAPFYVVWKILLIPRLIAGSRSQSAWVRTERVAARKIP